MHLLISFNETRHYSEVEKKTDTKLSIVDKQAFVHSSEHLISVREDIVCTSYSFTIYTLYYVMY